jgi:hypothetical protein
MEKENSGEKMNIRDFIIELALPEFKSVIGKGGGKIVFLVVILFISMIAMGIANGSLNYLSKKMNDPFVKFVDVYHKYEAKDGFDNFSLSLAQTYIDQNPNHISDVFETHTSSKFFFTNKLDAQDGTAGVNDGFVLKSNNSFYKKLKQDGFFTTQNKFHDESWGIIITEDFAKQRKIADNQAYINILTMGHTLPVPINARVKSLRDNKSFILTDKLFGLLYSQKEKIPEIISDSVQNYENWFLPSLNDIPQEFKDLGFEKVNINSKSSISYVEGILINRPIKNRIVVSDFDEQILNYNAQKAYDYDKLSFGDFSESREERLGTPEMYTLLFNNQDDVLKFNEWYKNTCGYSIEESKIEAKRNFGFFNHLSTLLSWALIAFSIISIVFFVINLLLAHINKNKKNLGTLKAFGLPNKNIVTLYSTITFVLVFSSCLISYILSSIFGQLILQAYIYISKIDTSNYITEVVFENNNFTSTIISFVIIPTIIILIRIIKYLHKITPGDLIYGRK